MPFSYIATITVDHTQVPSTQTNFTVLVSLTNTVLKTTGNGGQVTDAQGDDIRPYSDSALTTALSYYRERYNGTTGEIIMWVKIASLSSSVDTVFYLGIGDSTKTTDASSSAAWDSNTKGVWHLPDGTTLTAVNDVTGVGGTINGSTTVAAGQIDGAALFGTASTDSIVTDVTTHATQRTYSMWVYQTGNGGNSAGRIFDKRNSGGTQVLLLFNNNGVGNKIDFQAIWSGGSPEWIIDTAWSLNAWHKFVVTYDAGSTSNDPVFYLDGSSVSLTEAGTPAVGSVNTNSDAFVIGNRTSDNARNWAGRIDEFRIADTIRSADWVTTEWNNEKTGSTFLSATYASTGKPWYYYQNQRINVGTI